MGVLLWGLDLPPEALNYDFVVWIAEVLCWTMLFSVFSRPLTATVICLCFLRFEQITDECFLFGSSPKFELAVWALEHPQGKGPFLRSGAGSLTKTLSSARKSWTSDPGSAPACFSADLLVADRRRSPGGQCREDRGGPWAQVIRQKIQRLINGGQTEDSTKLAFTANKTTRSASGSRASRCCQTVSHARF